MRIGLLKLLGVAFSLSLLSLSAQATVVQGTLGTNQWNYIPFTYSGGALDINVLANGWTGGPTGSGLPDSYIYLFANNGSPIGALTGSLINYDDDSTAPGWNSDGSTIGLDSYLPGQSLSGGSYILAISRFYVSEANARANSFSGSSSYSGDYQVTFSQTVGIDGNTVSAVPLPAALPLLASALGGLGLFGWRRRKKSPAATA